MLVLLSFGLVLVATVLLVVGLLADDGLALIYISIACSVLAGIVLVVATRMNKPKAVTTASGPAPLDEELTDVDAPTASEPVVSAPTAVTTPAAAPEPVAPVAEPDPGAPSPTSAAADESFAPVPATGAMPAPEAVTGSSEPVDAGDEDDDFFPIADYDDLSVNEILPLLPELYADEIDVVEERERAGKGRATVLNRLGELREVLAGAPADTTAAQVLAQRPPAKKATAKKATAKKATAKKTTAKKAPAKKTTAKKATASTKKATAKKTASTTKKATKKAAPAKKASAAKKATKANTAIDPTPPTDERL